MKKFLVLLLFIGASLQAQTSFSEKALNDVLLTVEGVEIKVNELLDVYKGKTVFIDLWAGWCKDCIVGMPKIKKLQKQYPEVVFVFLSLDKTPEEWKKAIKKYKVSGEHYYISSGWKGDFCSSIDLDWIPRYIVVGANGEIKLYRAIEADAPAIKTVLEITNE